MGGEDSRFWRVSLEDIKTRELRGFAYLKEMVAYHKSAPVQPDHPEERNQAQTWVNPQGDQIKKWCLRRVGAGQEDRRFTMYIRINIARIKASKEEEFAEFGNTDEVHAVWKTGKGFLGGYLLQSLEEPQAFISCTLWETPEACQAFFASAEYRAALGGVAPLMESLPEGGTYAARAEYTA